MTKRMTKSRGHHIQTPNPSLSRIIATIGCLELILRQCLLQQFLRSLLATYWIVPPSHPPLSLKTTRNTEMSTMTRKMIRAWQYLLPNRCHSLSRSTQDPANLLLRSSRHNQLLQILIKSWMKRKCWDLLQHRIIRLKKYLNSRLNQILFLSNKKRRLLRLRHQLMATMSTTTKKMTAKTENEKTIQLFFEIYKI